MDLFQISQGYFSYITICNYLYNDTKYARTWRVALLSLYTREHANELIYAHKCIFTKVFNIHKRKTTK